MPPPVRSTIGPAPAFLSAPSPAVTADPVENAGGSQRGGTDEQAGDRYDGVVREPRQGLFWRDDAAQGYESESAQEQEVGRNPPTDLQDNKNTENGANRDPGVRA